MRSLATDFDLTVLIPLLLLAGGLLWNSIRRYLRSRSDYRASLKRIELPFNAREEEEEFLEWGSARCVDWRKDRKLLWLTSIVFVAICALMLMPDAFKVSIAEGFWIILWFISTISFIACIGLGWHYAREFDWLKFGLCILAILLIAASAEHFFHQKINARHVNCPHCSDDEEPDDN